MTKKTQLECGGGESVRKPKPGGFLIVTAIFELLKGLFSPPSHTWPQLMRQYKTLQVVVGLIWLPAVYKADNWDPQAPNLTLPHSTQSSPEGLLASFLPYEQAEENPPPGL